MTAGTDSPPVGALPRLRVERRRAWSLGDLAELWAYRELLYFFVWRDLKVRYKQTVLGVAWALLQPVASMLVFWLFFGKLAHVPSDGLPYPLFSLAGLVPWTYFATALTGGSNALVSNQALISRVYFPRLLIPLGAVVTPLVDFAISFVLIAALMAWYGAPVHATLLALPLLLLLLVSAAAAASFWLAALQAQYRDVRYLVPFLTQFWLFVTPVVYPASMVPAKWRALYGLNPLAGIITGIRWTLFGGPMDVSLMAVSVVAIAAALVSGYLYFSRLERTLADVV
ncbi:MAG TPA: ABC transporter permease [Vicinamibacterales bacterium]|nr:ABC transporter permease [Vicinamibacterales bacterium]